LAEQLQARELALGTEIEAVRASAAQERQLAVAEAERELEGARGELRAFREELRAARRREQERRQSPETEAAERERDRRLGAATERALRAEEALHELAAPLPVEAALSLGDPVVAVELGVRGTITTIEQGEAEVTGTGGLRVRVPLERLRPDAHRQIDREAEPAIHVLAGVRGDVSDQLDVRGTSAQEAREAVRSLVDQAALAGLPSVHVVHGRGGGVLRAAVREELAKHQLVDRYEADSADGATVVHLA
jgi:DNA mismatch repair protein MutS2